VSLSELDSYRYELRIRGGSMEVLCGDMVVIQGTRRGGLFEMAGTVEFASTVVSTSTLVGGDDMNCCGEATTVEIYYMAMSVIT
jgi:hypothetical protein